MVISTSGFVLTENKDIFEVLTTIENTLIDLIKKYAKEFPIFKDTTSDFPTIECCPGSRYFTIRFKVNDESRMLMVHFNCDCDYSEYGSSKIIWSVNYWGLDEEIVLGICQVMKQYGRVFYKATDFDGNIVEV